MTNEQLTALVEFALAVEREQMSIIGRHLEPTERTWVVRAAFRARFVGVLDRDLAEMVADQVLSVIDEVKQGVSDAGNEL